MTKLENIEQALTNRGYNDFKWIAGKDVMVRQWVRMKCQYGCPSYGERGCCPPNVPTIKECKRLFKEYDKIAVIHFAKKLDNPDDRHKWCAEIDDGLMQLEQEVFLSGFHKTFLLGLGECTVCDACPGSRDACPEPGQGRSTPEAMGVDVYGTVRQLDYPIQVLSDYDQEMNRYAFLLVE